MQLTIDAQNGVLTEPSHRFLNAADDESDDAVGRVTRGFGLGGRELFGPASSGCRPRAGHAHATNIRNSTP